MMKRTTIVLSLVLGTTLATISWSPAGAQFPGRPGRFVSRANGLTTYARDGSDPTILGLGSGVASSVEYPSFTPSGGAIVFDALATDDAREIFRVPAGGGEAVQLTDSASQDWGPHQGPKRIVFVCERASSEEICTMNRDGSAVRRLTRNDDADWNPKWSPNGRRIVFSSDRRGNFDIFSMRANGAEVRRLTTSPRDENEPDYAPDGSQIVFWVDGAGADNLVLIRADGTHRNRLAVDMPYPSEPRTPVWSPNGRRIAFGIGDQIWSRAPNDDADAIKVVVDSGSSNNIGWQPR